MWDMFASLNTMLPSWNAPSNIWMERLSTSPAPLKELGTILHGLWRSSCNIPPRLEHAECDVGLVHTSACVLRALENAQPIEFLQFPEYLRIPLASASAAETTTYNQFQQIFHCSRTQISSNIYTNAINSFSAIQSNQHGSEVVPE